MMVVIIWTTPAAFNRTASLLICAAPAGQRPIYSQTRIEKGLALAAASRRLDSEGE
jgi:hypothetical protein